LRLKLRELFEVAGVGHHGGELLEGVELVHSHIIGIIKNAEWDNSAL
jgi:hypothetical protein